MLSTSGEIKTYAYTYRVPCLLRYVFVSGKYLWGYDWEVWLDNGFWTRRLENGHAMNRQDADAKADEAYARLKAQYITNRPPQPARDY